MQLFFGQNMQENRLLPRVIQIPQQLIDAACPGVQKILLQKIREQDRHPGALQIQLAHRLSHIHPAVKRSLPQPVRQLRQRLLPAGEHERCLHVLHVIYPHPIHTA